MIGIGSAIVGGIGSINAANKADKANSNQLAWEQEQYANAEKYFEGSQGGLQEAKDIMRFGVKSGGGCAGAALAQAYDAKSYDMKAYMAESYQVELDGFINAFKDAEDINDISMDTFSRRYGQIMDNVKQNILDVSQERLSASGREQLALDAKTLSENFDQEMTRKGMGRSGISVESKQRMAMEVSKQARAIDVNSYDQANQLQAMGVQTLNSMTQGEQSIAMRGEQIHQNKARGLLSASMQDANLLTQTSHLNANNKTLASRTNATNKTNVSMTNATNRTNVSMTNATNATNKSMNKARIASAEKIKAAGIAQSQWAAGANFYSGGAGKGVSNGYAQQAQSAAADSAGWGKVAGWGMDKAFDAWGKA